MEENNPNNVELKDYIIVSKFIKENDNEPKSYLLPTPETLEKLCAPQIVKDVLTFDLKKYKAYFETNKDNDSDEEKNFLNLDKISSIKNNNLIPYILIFLGGINSFNTIYDFFDESIKNPKEECFIDKTPNYLIYLNSAIDFLKGSEKISIPFSEMDILFEILNELGIKIVKEDKNILYRNIKDSFLLMEKNKILILIAPSNNFWIKSEKNTINGQNYDIKLNYYDNGKNRIFYNKKFIKKFLLKIAKHPRCSFGLLSSMSYKNLKKCWDGLEKQFSSYCPKNIIFLDQEKHERISEKKFLRSMEKIKEHLKNLKISKDKDGENAENTEYFNEKNILILESEEDKKVDGTRKNSIYVNLFDEDYLGKNEKDQISIDLEGDKIIIVKFLIIML